MSGARKGASLLQSLASSWLALGVGVVVSFFLSPIVVNALGSAWYGIWAIAAQFTGYMYLLDFGVRESIVRYTSKYSARQRPLQLNRVLTAALLIYSVTTAVALILTAIGVWGVPRWFQIDPRQWREVRIVVALAGLTIAQTFLFNVFTGIVMGLRRWDIANVIGIGFTLLGAGLTVFFLRRGDGIIALAAVQCGLSLIRGINMIIIATTQLRRRGLTFRPTRLSRRRLFALSTRIFGYGFYVIVNNVGEKMIAATDAIVVGTFLPIVSVAYYAVAGSLIGFLRSILSATAQVFNPLASHLQAARQGTELNRALLLGVTISVLITLPAAAGFIILGETFIRLWMGEEFARPSSQVLSVLAVTAVLSAPQYIISSMLYGISKHRAIAVVRIVEGVANLTLSIVLVQMFGLIGVALGTAIPNAFMMLIVLPMLARTFIGVRLRHYYERAYVRPALAILPFAAVAYWLRSAAPAANLPVFFLQVGALLCVYLPSAFVVGLNAEERRLILHRVGILRAA